MMGPLTFIIAAIIIIANSFICSGLNWQGVNWHVKSGTGGPGPNNWSANNVFVDTDDRLHLNIAYNSTTKQWSCAELYTYDALSFGMYQWWVISTLDFDENVVFGLFFYEGPDGENEIDIEFSLWSDQNAKDNVGYTVWPAVKGQDRTVNQWDITLTGTYTTQRIS